MSSVPRKKARSQHLVEKSVEEPVALARKLVLSSWKGIIQGLIKKAIEGGYQQTKLLLELGQITQDETKCVTESDRQQLCDALLQGLQVCLPTQENCAEQPTQDEQQPIPQGDHDKCK